MARIGDSTRIWEVNIHWPLYSQCSVWDGRGVDIWECIVEHFSKVGTQPPNPHYWRYLARR
ncbi:hypothetical protein GYMLUDRAFT_177797 [Collybiopsis luxurians FD-317 M1]|uniref:Uncharacterized protein n=1 Tax=Collybiopsis luxurians FD-317 M1 TaxID=944289 RepID=A0A0D0C871_9AGAR|nr:hypothetical protein GYMLUDRAFT_177797 [Collybiopsis luxurians FD-317 M1]